MTLKSLIQYNIEASEAHVSRNYPRLNGIACPKCGNELMDSSPSYTLASNPPQTYIHCPVDKCGYKGTRVA